MNMLPEAEKALLSQFNELGVEEVRERLKIGEFGKDSSPKYKFAVSYLKEEDRRAKQEMLVESSIRLQHEANELAREASRKSDKANIIAICSFLLAAISIIISLYKG